VFLLIGVTLVLGLGGCATYATVSGASTPLGMLTSSSVNEKRGAVIAEYSVILGLITSGYEAFLEKIDGKEVDIIDTNYYVYRKIQAVKRN
jgi:hypothetical protein